MHIFFFFWKSRSCTCTVTRNLLRLWLAWLSSGLVASIVASGVAPTLFVPCVHAYHPSSLSSSSALTIDRTPPCTRARGACARTTRAYMHRCTYYAATRTVRRHSFLASPAAGGGGGGFAYTYASNTVELGHAHTFITATCMHAAPCNA
jgi:hypothetical protein